MTSDRVLQDTVARHQIARGEHVVEHVALAAPVDELDTPRLIRQAFRRLKPGGWPAPQPLKGTGRGSRKSFGIIEAHVGARKRPEVRHHLSHVERGWRL